MSPSDKSRIAAFEEEIRRLKEERDAALAQVRKSRESQAEKAAELRQSHQRLSEAERLSHTGAWEWDVAADRWIFSEEWLSIHGCAGRTLAPEDLLGIAHPDDRSAIERAFHDVREGLAPYHLEHRIVRPDGFVRHIRAHGQYVRDSSGNVTKVYGFAQDITEQVRMQQTLAESEEHARRIIDNTVALVGIMTPDGTLIEANATALRAGGLRREDVTGKKFWECYWWSYDVQVQAELRSAVEKAASGAIVRYDVVVRTAGDGRMPIDFMLAPVQDTAGRITHLIPSALDITERKQSEEALAQSEELVRTIAENSTQALMMMDERGFCTFANPASLAMTGYTAEEISTRRLHDLVHHHYPDGRPYPVEECPLDRALPEGFDVRAHRDLFFRKDGTAFPVLCAASPVFKAGQIVGTIIEVSDITKPERAEAVLRESEAKFRAVFEQAAVGMGRVSFADARWIDVNDALCRMLGYTPEEILSTPWPQITHPEDLDLDLIPFRKMAAGELESYSVEKRFIHKDGHHVWARLTLSLVRNPHGRPDYEIAVIENITERKRAEEASRESEQRFRDLADNMSQFAWMTDEKGWIFWYNKRWHEYTGTTLEEMQEWGWRKVHHPDHVERVVEKIRDCFQSGEFWEDTFPLRGRDGHYRWFLSRAVPIRGEDGKVRRWFGTNTDVTEQIMAEEALRASEERYHLVNQATNDIIWDWDLKTGEVAWNQAVEAAVDRRRAEMPHGVESWYEHIHPEDRERVVAGVHKAVSEGKSTWSDEYRFGPIGGPHGIYFDRGLIARDSSGEAYRMIGSMLDRTEPKKAEEALRESEERFRAMADGLPLIVWVHDAHGEQQFVNQTFCEFFGVDREKMKGENWKILIHPDDAQAYFTKFLASVRDQRPFHGEVRGKRRDGAWRWIESWAGPRFSSSGEFLGMVGTSADITERKRTEEEIKEAKAAAEEASQAKSEFLANMSHEIRTPITIFLAAIEYLLQIDRNPERRNLLEMADKSAKRLRSLIDDILDISRIEARKVEIEEGPFDLRDCVRQAVDLLALPAREKNLRLKAEIPEEIPPLLVGDPGRLGQVLVNLIGNAVKFTHQGEIRVRVQPRGPLLEFSVTDTGIGIPEEKRGLLFESFSQVDASFTRKYGGSGLGLAISKGLVERMKGEISFRSREGKGSTFVFTIPMKSPVAVHPGSSEAAPEDRGGRPAAVRILLAEDDPMIRQIIMMMLAKKKMQVEVAETGRVALEKWKAGDFDLILMDLQMPEMGGMDATRAIREREIGGNRRTCIIGLTAHARREVKEECLASGMDHVLTKPVQMNDLFSAIESCLPA